MPKVWNLGNTTVRNPNRIELGLRLFADEFQGNVHGPIAEQRFATRLTEEGIVESEGRLGDWLGRKWRSAFVKLGFATGRKYKMGKMRFATRDLAREHPALGLQGLDYEVTPVGNRLLQAQTTGAAQDVFLRQLVRHEIPSPVESAFPKGRMKPFIYVVQVLQELKRRAEPGLSTTEIAVFLQLFVDHSDDAIEPTVRCLLEFREQREAQDTRTAKREFDQAQLRGAAKVGGVMPDTLLAYADTTERYTLRTGLVKVRNGRLVLRENKRAIIEALLVEEPAFLAEEDPVQYLVEFYGGTRLPTDDAAVALEEIQRLSEELRRYGKKPRVDASSLSQATDIQDLEAARYVLMEQLGWAREEEFATAQMHDDSITETLRYLEALPTKVKSRNLGIVDRPAYLEWAVWRGFLAIDQIATPIYQTRRFPLDEDLLPRHPAPRGQSDMMFELDDYVLVVEVTLTSSSRQLSAEGEPVRRHVADVKEKATKDVYGIFIAPTIDNNTAETFRIGVWYREDQEEYLNIVPLTLGQFQQIIRALLRRRYTPRDLQQLIDRCLAYRNTRAPEWKRMIATEANRWIAQLGE